MQTNEIAAAAITWQAGLRSFCVRRRGKCHAKPELRIARQWRRPLQGSHPASCQRRCRRLAIRFPHPPSAEGRKGGPPSDINRSVSLSRDPPPPQPAMGPPQGSIWVPGWLHESAGSFVIPVGVARRFGGASHPSLPWAKNGPAFAANRRKPRQIAYSHLKMAPYLAPEEQTFWAGYPDISP